MEVHKCLDRPIQLEEYQNWIESEHNRATILLTAYNVDCIKLQNTLYVSDLFEQTKQHITQDIARTEKNMHKTYSEADLAEGTAKEPNINVTIKDIIHYAMKQKWVASRSKNTDSSNLNARNEEETSNSKNNKPNSEYMLFNLCK